MSVQAENRYQKVNRRQIDAMAQRSLHPWIGVMKEQRQQILDSEAEIRQLKRELAKVTQERDKAVKAYHRRNAEAKYFKFEFYKLRDGR